MKNVCIVGSFYKFFKITIIAIVHLAPDIDCQNSPTRGVRRNPDRE